MLYIYFSSLVLECNATIRQDLNSIGIKLDLSKATKTLYRLLELTHNQGWRQENSDRGADASDEGANYFGTKALKPDRS